MYCESCYYNNFKLIFLSVFILLSSCASDSTNFNDIFGNIPKEEGYKVVKNFFIKDNIFTTKCDLSGNQLVLKFSKKENKWKKSKYISKGCTFNFSELN